MKSTCAITVAVAFAMGAALQANDAIVTGDYVEARTAEVFTGGCIMGSEGEVSGREAILAWRVSHGSLNGVQLDGLSVVAVIAGDINLGTHELGGAAPTSVRTLLITDGRATPAQQQALVAMARSLAPRFVTDVVATESQPISFTKSSDGVKVVAGPANLDVATDVEHSPACGAVKWFGPLGETDDAKIGMTRVQEWSGDGLKARWKQIDRKSSFFGSFALGR